MHKNEQGIAHLWLFLVGVVVVGVVGFAGYRVGTRNTSQNQVSDTARSTVQESRSTPIDEGAKLETGAIGCYPEPLVAEANDAFTALPFKPEQIKVVTNGRETNDARFVYPWVMDDRVDLFAPADGKLYMIRHKVYEMAGKIGRDYDIFFAVDCKTVYRFNHVTHPRDDIKAAYPAGDLPSGNYAEGGADIPERVKPKVAVVVKAGESIGYTTSTLGAKNFDFAVGVAKSAQGDKLATCPFTVFAEPHKSALLALMGPKSTLQPTTGFPCDVEAQRF